MVTKNYLSIFSTTSEYEAAYNGGELDFPNVSLTEDDDVVHYEMTSPHYYNQDYLTFEAKEAGTFTFIPRLYGNTLSYSTDNGENWTIGNSVTVDSGDKVFWKGTIAPDARNGVGRFSSTANFDVQGNVMSLLYGDNFKGKVDLSGKIYTFYQLFYNNTKVLSAENLSLPATTLADGCYSNMFQDCTALTTAPELPATTLVKDCYYSMFSGCTSLETAPELIATILPDHCYDGMFYNCSSLNYIKAMFTTTPSSSYTNNWVRGVSSTGTFVKNSAATWNVTGNSGIPTGWTVETASA